MNNLKSILSKTLLGQLWQAFWIRYYFKFVLPRVKEINLEGVRLDVSTLPLKIRNRLMNAGYETQEKNMCRDFLTADDSVLEIGAAIGFIGLFCQKMLGIRNYVLFEANPRTFHLLKKNYELNGLKPMAWNVALAEMEGRVELNVGTDFWENSIVPSGDDQKGRKTMDVPAAPLGVLLKKAEHTVNVLIIDVEGAEQFIDWDEIPREINKIIIELHPRLLGAEKTYNLISALIVKGFVVAREDSGTFVFLRDIKIQPTAEHPLFQEAIKSNGEPGREEHRSQILAC
jgi:FkbM family methyltransferase